MSTMRTMPRLALAALVTIIMATPAAAQTCGDANGNDTITVTDGVQALRAAADLSSSCDDGCDTDGSGSITVSDGVNILRKAAGIAINEACDFTGSEANSVVDPSLSVFGAITKTPGFGSLGLVPAGAGDCENDGTVETTFIGPGQTQSVTTFTDCDIDGATLDGAIGRVVTANGTLLGFEDFTITKTATGKSIALSGQLAVTSTPNGKRIAGTLTIVSSERGTFTLQFERILVVADGSVRDGILIYDLTKATTPKVAGVRIAFDESDQIPVAVLLRNKQTLQFLLDRGTRTLHRAR